MNVRQNALALAEADQLAEFWTCLHFDVRRWPWKLLPGRLLQRLDRRSFALPDPMAIHGHPWRELGRHGAAALGLHAFSEPCAGPLSVDAVYHSLDRRVARRMRVRSDVTGVFCSEDGALETFRAAKAMGRRCFYELPMGYWRAARELLQEEAERQPAWAPTLVGNRDTPEKLDRKDEELALADAVLVASRFSRGTLAQAQATHAPVLVLPYRAMDDAGGSSAAFAHPPRPVHGRKLRLLYVGSLTQRKGLSYLLEAVQALEGRVELTLIGRPPAAGCKPLEEAMQRHRWIASLPRDEILAEMRRHDLLMLPSLFEGFGLVLVEALSQGLPVIATDHSGAPDIIEDGREGFIVPIRSSDAMVQKLEMLDQDRERLAFMGENASRTASRLLWSDYRRELSTWVAGVMNTAASRP